MATHTLKLTHNQKHDLFVALDKTPTKKITIDRELLFNLTSDHTEMMRLLRERVELAKEN